MRADHVTPGQRVKVTGGKHSGLEGTVVSVRLSSPSKGLGYQTFCRARATIQTDHGDTIEAQPRWMELAESASDQTEAA